MDGGLISLLTNAAIVPVLTIERAADAGPLAKALHEGGVSAVEVTLRTDAALSAVAAIKAEAPEVTVGVGTVMKAEDIQPAIRAGASFLVSPGTPPELAAALAAGGVPALPGCATVSEAMSLRSRGFNALKFFPAEACGGASWLRSVAAPLPDAMFCPTGGIDQSNAAAYLALSNVVAIGGSWIVPRHAVERGDWASITGLARAAMALARRR